MATTRLSALRINNWQAQSPGPLGGTGGRVQRLRQLLNFLNGLLGGAVKQPVVLSVEYDQVAATNSVVFDAAGSGAQTATINGVDSAVTYASSVNNTALLLLNKINCASNALIYQHALATERTLVNSTGTYTIVSASGTISATIDGTQVDVTATGVDAADAKLLAAAINADGTVSPKVFATNALGVVTLTAQGHCRATITISSGAGTITAYINGIPVSTTWVTSDTVTATALALAINADSRVNQTVRASSAAGVVTVIAKTAGDFYVPVGATGTGATSATTGPVSTITLSGASGTITGVVNGARIAVTYATSDTVTAAALAAAINANTNVNRLVTATSAAGVVTITSRSAITLAAAGTGTTASAAILAAAGTYGGIAGDALTTTAAGTGLTADQATLAGGATSVSLVAVNPGHAGNAVTLACTGNNITATSALFTGGTAVQVTSTFPG
jgi:hypothetical protein